MSRHRRSAPEPEKPGPDSRADDGPAPLGRPLPGAGDPDHGGRANGAGPRDGRPRRTRRPHGSLTSGDGRDRGSQAQPSWIAEFARSSDRRDAASGPISSMRVATPGAAAPDRDGIGRTVATGVVVPAQRDRSGGSGPHRPADRTVALPTARAPAPPSPAPRTAPARPADAGTAPDGAGRTDTLASVPEAASTTRVPAPRPTLVAPGAAESGAEPRTSGPGIHEPGTAEPGTPEPGTPDRRAGGPAAEPVPATAAAPAPPAPPAPRAAPAAPARPDAAPGRADGERAARPSGNRLLGVDVARGAALFGIIAVHALVEGTEDGAPATNYLVFGGRSAALFALLAGVSLAFMTGRAPVRWGRDLRAAAAMVAARACVLLVIGLALGWTDPEIAAVILPYYAVMFLLAVPLLVLPTGVLAGVTVVLVGAVPVLSQLMRPALPVPTLDNPHLVDVVTDPLGLLSELTVTGAYPAVTWLAYLAAGLVIGRLRLRSRRTGVALVGAGTAAALAAAGASWWLLGPAGGYAQIAAVTPPDQLATAPTVADFVAASPDGVTPTTTWWWLATIAPHSGTPLDLVQTIGSAAAVLGAALLLAGIARQTVARPLGYVLRPVAAAGSMTLTLYVVSLLFMNSPLDDYGPLEGYLWQVGAALVIGTAWRRAVGRGPLEAATSTVAKAARDRVRVGRTRDRVGGADRTGPSVADGRARR